MANFTESTHSGDTPEEILHPDSRELFRFWERVRGENSAIARNQVDLRQIRKILPWIAILERHPLRPAYTWRLAGSGVCRIWNAELTAQPFLADASAYDHDTICRLLDNVVASHQPCISRYKAVYEDGEMLGLEMLAVPVLSASGTTTQLLCSVVPFRAPYWLGQACITRLELSKVKMIWTEHFDHHANHTNKLIDRTRVDGGPLLRVIDGGREN